MIVAIDLETTGVDKNNDKIIEIALVKFDENTFEITEVFSTLINPLIPIPDIVSNITNIFDFDVKDAPVFDDKLIQKIENFIGDLPILGHNTNFDKDFLLKNGVNIKENIILDTFLLSNIILLYEKSLNLGNLCESLEIPLTNTHRALDDAILTIKLFEKLILKFKKLENSKKDLLNFIFSKSNSKAFFYCKRLFDINDEVINNEDFIKKTLEVVGKYKEEKKEEKKDFNLVEIKEIFKNLPLSETRENQLQMSLKIEDLLLNNKKVVIEAPTGIGKTFAYLIPSIIYSLKSSEQVIISTNTKTLQDQIFYKDLKFLKENLGYSFSFSKLKGKKNYFSVSRYLDYLLNNNNLDESEVSFFSKICLWLFDTDFGELDELNFYPNEYFLQKSINSDNFLFLLENNDYKDYEYIFKARSKAKKSNIIVVNHSLLIQDAITTNNILGQIKNLIIDEAHNLEDATTDALTKEFSLKNLEESLNKILDMLKKSNFSINNLDKKFDYIYSHISLLFDLLIDYTLKKNTFGNENYDVLIESDFFLQNKDIKNLKDNIEISFIEIFNLLQTSPDKIFNSLKAEIGNLEEIIEIIKICLDENSCKDFIPIFSFNKDGNSLLRYTVLKPGKFLKKIFWDKADSILLTSATLKTNGNFDYIKDILFLFDFDYYFFESDFDYSSQALLFIPNDLGSIKYNNSRINDFILKFLNIVRGNTLILLTSFNSIKDLFLTLNVPLKKIGTSVLAQGVNGSKHRTINHFKNYASNSVILGTDSFWEGVDIPGEDLKYLFIHKFPFLVPTDPIFKARGKLYSDSFTEYSIPKAIIKTKQGFGRLIRTKKDTGIIVLLDDRYFSTDWGISMKSSFPSNINIKIGSSDNF